VCVSFFVASGQIEASGQPLFDIPVKESKPESLRRSLIAKFETAHLIKPIRMCFYADQTILAPLTAHCIMDISSLKKINNILYY